MKAIKLFAALFAAAVTFTACGEKNPVNPPVEPVGTPEVEAVEGKIVVVLNAIEEATPVGDVYLVGSFCGWSTDVAQVAKLEAIDGYDGWYKAEITPDADTVMCKAAHAAPNGKFSWDYEWTADSFEVLEETDMFAEAADNGYGELTNLKLAGTGVVYVQVTAWKNTPVAGDEPQEPAEAKDITVKAKVPAAWTNTITAWVWPTDGEGQEVTPTKEGDWYVYTHNCVELNIIFKNGEGWNGDANQTVDIKGIKENTCLVLESDGATKATYTNVDCE